MKRILLTAAIVLGAISSQSFAQVNVNVNIGSQPVWGPVGYDYVQYYYMPDLDVYYDVPRRQYVYLDGPNWVYHRSLPPRYVNYDVYHTYKVVVNEPSPWRRHDHYRTQYVKYKGRKDQPFIRDSRDERYFVNRRHPQHQVWVQQHPAPPRQVGPPRGPGRGNGGHPGHGNGRGNGHEKGHGKGHGR